MGATLLVLAAGMASRYGSLKQIDKFGPAGESIIDYSIYDAIEAGFTKVVFIIRKEFEQEFKEIFEPRLQGRIETAYVYQPLEAFTESFIIPTERSKPWGTAHAVLCAKDEIDEPFAVINGDDFYGHDAFKKAYHFITEEAAHNLWANICYELNNTLSDYGSVSRGICEADEDNFITSIVERTKVYRNNNLIVAEENGQLLVLDEKAKASMNFWCFTPHVFEFSLELFQQFLSKHMHEPKSEFFIPLVGDEFIKQGKGNIKAITTSAKWFGVTYKEDKPIVQECINQLIQQKVYPASLWQNELFQQPIK
jgi:UTP-glucose-1-phosphate uridylyltransferase